jgi:hypothetical protein
MADSHSIMPDDLREPDALGCKKEFIRCLRNISAGTM